MCILRALLVPPSRAPVPRQPHTLRHLLASCLDGHAGVWEEGGESWGPGLGSPSPVSSVGSPGLLARSFSTEAVPAGLWSFTEQFTVNSPPSVQCPEQRSPGEEGPGGQQGDGRGGVGGVSFLPLSVHRAGCGR